MSGHVRVFCAVSLDGFLAGVDDDLSWLPEPSDDGDDGGFAAFLSDVGALLMGRRTYDVVDGFDVPWPYGGRPVLVATHRPLASTHTQVRAVAGTIHTLVAQALEAARGQDVYVDGGHLVRDALDAGLVDRVTLTQVPVVLGHGIPLFAGCSARRRFRPTAVRPLAHGMVQLELVPE
jgi:dihydrofolate reductase